MIELRYVKSGNAYLPQFKQPEFGDEWKFFNKDTFTPKSILGVVTIKLASINTGRNWSSYQYHFNDKDDKRVYFLTEIQVMAFLGAAKSFYSSTVHNFEI